MAKEVLVVPEERLGEVIRVIRAGLKAISGKGDDVTNDTWSNLTKWCNEQEAYLKRLSDPGE